MARFLRLSKYRRLKRYNQIINVLVKYGFGYLVRRTGILNIFYKGRNILNKSAEGAASMNNPERVRKVLEELGPTFIKIGQLLSLRPDLIPAEYVDELKKLQDKTTTIAFKEIIKVFEEELGADAAEVFLSIDEQPLAAASIAQVHSAVLKSGENVVVKIMKPHVLEIIENDLSILFDIARLVEEKFDQSFIYQPVNVVEELADALKRELDYNKEGRNADRFRKYVSSNHQVHVPKIYWEYTRKRVIVMEYIHGTKINDVGELKKSGKDTKKISNSLAHCFMSQVFEHGFFHADPHPGNIIIMESGKIAFIDFGMVGIIDDWMMDALLGLLINIVNKDIKKIADAIVKLGVTRKEVNYAVLKRDIREFIDEYYDRSLKDIEVSKMLNEVMKIAFRHGIGMPSQLTMLVKAMVTIESVINDLDPEFLIMDIFKQYSKKAIKDKYKPLNITKDFMENAQSILSDLIDIPAQVAGLLEKANSDKIKIDFVPTNVDDIINNMHKMVNRMVLSVIVGAIIVGSSLISKIHGQKDIFGMPLFSFIGFTFGGIMGLWIIISILKSGKI